MKYVQPYGISDPEAPYINGDPSIARMGSIPPAAAFEHPMREVVAVIDYSTLVPTGDDLEQLAKGIRSQRMNYVEDTGSADALSVALDPPLEAYTIGLPLHVKIRVTNTGPATIDAGAGRVSIRKPNGTEMAAGDLPANGLAALVYDGTVFQMINFGGAGAGGPTNIIVANIPYTTDTGTVNTVVANFTGGQVATLVPGTIFMVKIANTNNTFANINVNGLGLKAINAQGGHPNWPLLPGDIMVGDVVVFMYDGTRFWIFPNAAINQNITFNVSTIAQINDLFVALGRKRISASGSITIQMAAGTYNQRFTTYHADADRITIQGTMAAGGVPVANDFHSGGNSPAQRANDSSFNIQMLRARYLTEIKFTNSPNGYAIIHNGPGMITFKNLLITGANVATPNPGIVAIGPNTGSAIVCDGVTVWGSGEVGFSANAGYLDARNCHAANNHGNGFDCAAQGAMSITRGGAYGNGGNGVLCSANGMVWASAEYGESEGPYFTSNASSGAMAVQATINVNYVTSVSNAIDFYAQDMGAIINYASLAGSVSPAVNEEGNLNSIYRVF